MSTKVLCVRVVACLHCDDKMTRYPESIYLIRSTRKDGWERSTLSITLKMESMRWVQEDERRQDMKSRTGEPTDGGNTASTSRAFGRIGRTSVSWLVATGFLKREHAHSPQQTRFHQRINLTLLACECSVKGEWDQEFKELSRGIRDVSYSVGHVSWWDPRISPGGSSVPKASASATRISRISF